MENKQIIIDGVDVSKCEYLQYKGCNFPQCLVKIASFDLKCEGYNCHLKRLVQKEQECEKLKKQVEIFTRQLEKANREVIKEKEKNATQRQKNAKLKQTLTEIKEIAKQMNNECFYNDFSCDGCDMINGCTYFNKSKILQIIKEMK